MCGITGVLNLNGEPVALDVLHAMTDAIAHRGPDGEGYYCQQGVGLAHRRLSIIDLSPAASQPMISEDGRYVLSYNGETYNFQELRRELQQTGYRFRSNSDTEVVLYALAEWGERALNRFNGMFALALWDEYKQELFLARDRYGIKPLYYTQQGSAFAFGSEVKALRAHPHFRAELDKEAMLEYFTFQNFFTDRTLFEGVKLLPAGTFLRLSAVSQKEITPVQYWDYQFVEPDESCDDIEYLEELDRLFSQAVQRQLVSDVDVGSYLSGGMDSGAITAIAAGQLTHLKTFTAGFDMRSASVLEMGFDERETAQMMSRQFKTEHTEIVLKAGDMERCLARLTWHLEEPRVGQSYPNFYVSQLAGKFVKVVLSGTGGDELFGGYPWRYYRAVVNNDFEHYIDKYYLHWQRLMDNSAIRAAFQSSWAEVGHVRTRDIFRGVFNKHASELTRPEDYVNHSLYLEAKTFLHGLLTVEDKLSMAHGLETRVPFLDNDLVDFATRLPVHLKLGNLSDVIRINENEPGSKTALYFNKTKDGKILLRRMMARYLPSEVVHGVKQGFSAPDASWFRHDCVDYVKQSLCDPSNMLYDYLDYESIQLHLNEHLDGKENRRLLIWSLLYMDKWFKQFLS